MPRRTLKPSNYSCKAKGTPQIKGLAPPRLALALARGGLPHSLRSSFSSRCTFTLHLQLASTTMGGIILCPMKLQLLLRLTIGVKEMAHAISLRI